MNFKHIRYIALVLPLIACIAFSADSYYDNGLGLPLDDHRDYNLALPFACNLDDEYSGANTEQEFIIPNNLPETMPASLKLLACHDNDAAITENRISGTSFLDESGIPDLDLSSVSGVFFDTSGSSFYSESHSSPAQNCSQAVIPILPIVLTPSSSSASSSSSYLPGITSDRNLHQLHSISSTTSQAKIPELPYIYIEKNGDSTMFKCPYCEKFDSKQIYPLEQHIKTHLGATRITCSTCKRDCYTKNYQTAHCCQPTPAPHFTGAYLKEHPSAAESTELPFIQTARNILACPYCTTFSSEKIHALERHISTHLGAAKITCNICQKDSFTKNGQIYHRCTFKPLPHFTRNYLQSNELKTSVSQNKRSRRSMSAKPKTLKRLCPQSRELLPTYPESSGSDFDSSDDIFDSNIISSSESNSEFSGSDSTSSSESDSESFDSEIDSDHTSSIALPFAIYMNDKIKCPHCRQFKLSLASLNEHIYTHRNAPKVTCETCKREMYTQNHLTEHRCIAMPTPQLTSDYLRKYPYAQQGEELPKAIQVEKDKKCYYACPYCDDLIPNNPGRLNMHIGRRHPAAIKVSCKKCAKTTYTKTFLKSHKHSEPAQSDHL